METLTLTASEFRALVGPVLPMAGRDYELPVLTSVQIESDGEWLSASATDRFRLGIKRIKKRATDEDPTTAWPEFKALIPTRAIKSLLASYKPRRGTMDPTITLTVEDGKLTAEAVGLFDLFDAARFVHHLEGGEFPNLRSVMRKAMELPADERGFEVGFNPAFMADFKGTGASTLRLLMGTPKTPMIFTDDDGFIGCLMPRAIPAEFREDWTDFLAEKPALKKAASKKANAA